jgi:hypothetical protein
VFDSEISVRLRPGDSEVLRQIISNIRPEGFRANEDMLLGLNASVVIKRPNASHKLPGRSV